MEQENYSITMNVIMKDKGLTVFRDVLSFEINVDSYLVINHIEGNVTFVPMSSIIYFMVSADVDNEEYEEVVFN